MPKTPIHVDPLKRALQQHVLDPLALALLEGRFGRGDAVVADVEGGANRVCERGGGGGCVRGFTDQLPV